MADLIRRHSALEAVYQQGLFPHQTASDAFCVTLQERHPLTMFDIGGNVSDKAFIAAIETALACPLPKHPNTVIRNATQSLLWLSPTRWLCVESENKDKFLAEHMPAVKNVSSGRTVIRLAGRNVRDVLAKGCPLDMHANFFQVDHCAQSRIGGLNILVDHVDDHIFDLYVARSFALTFWQWLTEAATEYGYQVTD